MRPGRRHGKRIGVIAGIVAVAVVAVVLIISATGAPDNDTEPVDRIVAILDGEEITEKDVADARVVIFWAYDRYVGHNETLEHLIAEKLLYREAEREDYVPTTDDTWVELTISVGMRGLTMEEFEERLEWDGLSLEGYIEHFRRMLAINIFLEDTVEVPDVTEEDIREFYQGYVEDHRERYPDEEPPTLEEMEPHIVAVLEAGKRQEAASHLIEQLREKADIQYMEVDW
ncbi:MAG: hypothetical protein E3J25_08845 [Anaerolineales bacterium]|nr:MAG: hypothetical protein E3J25_08845 [Anaerolineales bacterium]